MTNTPSFDGEESDILRPSPFRLSKPDYHDTTDHCSSVFWTGYQGYPYVPSAQIDDFPIYRHCWEVGMAAREDGIRLHTSNAGWYHWFKVLDREGLLRVKP